jgi:hypothetical protein
MYSVSHSKKDSEKRNETFVPLPLDARIDQWPASCEMIPMKSAYELAMERLNKSAPAVKLTEKQKKDLAELDSVYASKIAQREIFLKGELAKAEATGDFEAIDQLQKQLTSERKTLNAELEEKKEKVRGAGKA